MPSTRRSTIAECKELARRVEELSGAPEGILEIADVALYGVVNDPSSVAETLRSFLEGRSRESAAARSGASTGGTIRVGTSGTPSASTAHRWPVEVDPRTGASSVVIDEDASEQEREEALRTARTTAGSVDATRGTVAPPDATTADEERRRANAERTRRWREARRAAEESNAASEAVRREANAQRTREWRRRRSAGPGTRSERAIGGPVSGTPWSTPTTAPNRRDAGPRGSSRRRSRSTAAGRWRASTWRRSPGR